MSVAIRVVLTLALIYLVFLEAGPWTAVAIGLIAVEFDSVRAQFSNFFAERVQK